MLQSSSGPGGGGLKSLGHGGAREYGACILTRRNPGGHTGCKRGCVVVLLGRSVDGMESNRRYLLHTM